MEKKDGTFLIILGIFGFLVASNMNTTVSYDNQSVFNIGLMNKQQNAIILSAVCLIIGTLIKLLGKDNNYKKMEALEERNIKTQKKH